MESVKEKMEKLADHIRDVGYPKRHDKDNVSYRLDDEYFAYDLFDDNNNNISILIVDIEYTDSQRIPIWGAFYNNREFFDFISSSAIRRRK